MGVMCLFSLENEEEMFKFVGAIVVMGFAGYGLLEFIQKHVVLSTQRGSDPG